MLKTDFEEELPFSMLICVDGNDSLKRLRQLRSVQTDDESKTIVDVELDDREYRESALYLEEAVVEKYKDEVKRRGSKVFFFLFEILSPQV